MNYSRKSIKANLYILLFILSIMFIKKLSGNYETVHAASFEWGTIKVSAGSKLNMRAAANTKTKIIASYSSGKKVKITPSTLKKTWVKVTVDGKTGWAYGCYIETAYGTASDPYKYIKSGVTNDKTVVRKSASHSAAAVVIVPKNSKLQVLTKEATWVKVKYNGKVGYCVGSKINVASTGKTASGSYIPGSTASKLAAKRQNIVDYAKKFLGNKYVYGGTSLTNGTDCSGFTQSIYKHFGYSIPRTSTEQRYCGISVSSLSKAVAGDLICYYGHVAIFMGGYKKNGVNYPYAIIHASNAKDGIKITLDCRYRSIAAIRRIIK